MKKSWFVVLLTLWLVWNLGADFEFEDYTLTAEGKLLFSLKTSDLRVGSYKNLFLTDLKAQGFVQYTFFPEELIYLKTSGLIQIRNRFGVFRTDSDLKNITVLNNFSSFVKDGQLEEGKIAFLATSPDGRYLVYYQPLSLVFGRLILYDTQTAQEVLVAEDMPLALEEAGISWSPDARLFLYAKENQLYFYSLDYLQKGRQVAENYRQVGKGSLASVKWDARGGLYYLEGNLLTKIESAELFARALYAGSVNIGTIVGKLPFAFNPAFDRFWLSPDGKKIIFNKGQQSLFFFYLQSSDYQFSDPLKSLPFLYLPRSLMVEEVIWSFGDQITILACGLEQGREVSRIFRLAIKPDGSVEGFNQQPEKNVKSLVLADDQKTVLLLSAEKVDVYGYANWQKLEEIPFKGALKAVWKSPNEIILAGSNTIEVYDRRNKSFRLLALARVDSAGLTTDGKSILAKVDNQVYQSALDRVDWQKVSSFNFAQPLSQTAAYRVYLENFTDKNFKNMLFIRDLNGLITRPLLPSAPCSYEAFPKEEEPVDLVYFNHGSRLRAREVALVFNASFSLEGLSYILKVLKEYKLTVTFFINGEFLRRYPDAVKEIAASGHEIGSLFYSYFDMTDSRYALDTDFIKKGLARNEDEYFKLTGKELSLLWHTPYYFTSSSIIEASKEMNYVYVGRDVDSLDWIGRQEASATGLSYNYGPQLVERILNLKKPGSIIPIEIGALSASRDDYLFQYLGLLINGLQKLGYQIVPVSRLLANAR